MRFSVGKAFNPHHRRLLHVQRVKFNDGRNLMVKYGRKMLAIGAIDNPFTRTLKQIKSTVEQPVYYYYRSD